MIDIDQFFFDHPEYKAYFYPGLGSPKNPPDEPVKLASVAEMIADYFDMVYHQRKSMPPGTFEGFEEFMRSVYRHAGPLQEHVQRCKGWYPPEFLASLKQTPQDERPS